MLVSWAGPAAGDREILDRAKSYYASGDYYTAITEAMRYQSLYPAGPFFPESMLIAGKAYFRGNNVTKAEEVLLSCHRNYPDRIEGEESLYMAGYVHLLKGSPRDAARLSDVYAVSYPKGLFREELDRNNCYILALMSDTVGSMNEIRKYKELYPDGKYVKELGRLEDLTRDEWSKPGRSAWISVIGSVFFPGFGHFYTGNYAVGCLTFITNALCGFLIYNASRNRNTFQIVFFSAAGATAYSYNIWSAIRQVDEFNLKRSHDFFKSVRLGITGSF
jgi:hypothetical protein